MIEESLRKLEECEKASKKRVKGREVDEEDDKVSRERLTAQSDEVDVKLLKQYGDDDDDDDDDGNDGEESDLDLDSNSDDDSESDSDDDEDEEELIRAEMERIRKERAEEAAERERESKRLEEASATMEAMTGNPLLNQEQQGGGGGKIKRKWNDDVVFRNQSRKETKYVKRFVNDTVRNDFHKRFMDKFMK